VTGEEAGAPEREGPRANRPWVRPLMRLIQVLLIVAVAYFLGAYLWRSWSSIREYEWTFRPGWLVLSALAFLAFYAAQAFAWWLLLRGFELVSPLPVATSTWAKSILARYLPGNVFMFVGRAWMCHRQGLSIERVSAAMVYEQALGVCSALVMLAILFPFWEYRAGLTALSLLMIPVIVVLLHPRVFGPLAERLLALLHRPALGVCLPFGRVVGLLAFFSGSWLLSGAGAWLLGRALVGLEVDALPMVIAAYALAYVAGMVAFVFPSGIGVREAVLTASLARQLPGGVALAWALFLRLWVTVVELTFVGLAVSIDLLVRRRSSR
jgi:glycosyltransferase 2 family protein